MKGDYISHHMPAPDRFAEALKLSKAMDKTEKRERSTKTLASRGMSFERKVAAGFIVAGHIFALWALVDMASMTFTQGLKWMAAAIALYVWSGTMGITAGAHRLWAHRSYKANVPARILIMLANSMANQSSILHWAMEHRVHHQYSDTDADPHDITRGFFYAHMGWLFAPRTDAFAAARKKIDDTDLRADPVVMFQDKYYFFIGPFMCYIFPTILGHLVTGETWRSFLMLGALRWIITLHVTWCVNSVAHTFGERPYRPNEKPTEFGLVSLISGGEGWHNWHHAFPWDYAASEMRADVFWRFNLARFWIDSFAAIGWVWDRKVQRHGDVVKTAVEAK